MPRLDSNSHALRTMAALYATNTAHADLQTLLREHSLWQPLWGLDLPDNWLNQLLCKGGGTTAKLYEAVYEAITQGLAAHIERQHMDEAGFNRWLNNMHIPVCVHADQRDWFAHLSDYELALLFSSMDCHCARSHKWSML